MVATIRETDTTSAAIGIDTCMVDNPYMYSFNASSSMEWPSEGDCIEGDLVCLQDREDEVAKRWTQLLHYMNMYMYLLRSTCYTIHQCATGVGSTFMTYVLPGVGTASGKDL